MKSLAIVIPVYKHLYFNDVLDSIANQTCKDFTLYIGNDASTHEIDTIVKKYCNKIDIVYKYFEYNLGKNNLVGQWERCIDLSNGEPYIWLFSDDDIMSPNCVEEFIKLPDEIKNNYLIHYDIATINEIESTTKKQREFPTHLSAKEYLDEKLCLNGHKGLVSYVVEFIFSRDIYNQMGKFEKFDLAWGADFITWLKFSSVCSGIYTIKNRNALVYWRRSLENITPNKSHSILIRKLKSQIEYITFIKKWLKEHNYKFTFKYAKNIFGTIKRNLKTISKEDLCLLRTQYNSLIGKSIVSEALFYYFILTKKISL